MASLLSAVKSKAKRNTTTTTTTINRGRLSSYSSEDSNNNGDSSTTSSYNSGNQSPIAMNNYQKLSSSTEEEEDTNNHNSPSNNINNSLVSKDNDDSTTLTPIQNVYNNPNRFIMTDVKQQQVGTDDSVAKKRSSKTAAQRHFNSQTTAKQQPSSTAAKQKVRNNNNRGKVPRGRNSNRRRGANSRKSTPTQKDEDDLIIKTAVAIDNYVADSNCSPTGIENIKQSTKKFGFKLFKEALSCYDDVTTPNDEGRLRSKGDDYFDNVEDDIDEISQKLFPDGEYSIAGTSVTSSNSFIDNNKARPSVRCRSMKDRRLQELETRSVTSIHTTNTISSLNNLCGANIDLSILEEALDITSNEIEQLQSKSMMEHIQSKSSKLKNVDKLLVCNGGSGCNMTNVDNDDEQHDDRVNRLKSLTKKFSKTQKNIKKSSSSSIPVSKKDTPGDVSQDARSLLGQPYTSPPTKQKAAVKIKKNGEEKKLDESLDFAMVVEEEKKELDKSLDWLDVEDVSFFDVGTNVFSGSGGGFGQGEEVQL